MVPVNSTAPCRLPNEWPTSTKQSNQVSGGGSRGEASFARRTEMSREAGSHHSIEVADDPSDDDPAVQARTVEQRFEHFLAKQGLEIEARYVHTPTVEHAIANAKILSHQMA